MPRQLRSIATTYRQRAQAAREAARLVAFEDARYQLLETAQYLEALAENEERGLRARDVDLPSKPGA